MIDKEKLLNEINELLRNGVAIQQKTHSAFGVVYCDKAIFSGWKSNIISTLKFFGMEKTEHFKYVEQLGNPDEVYPETVKEVVQQLYGLAQIIQKDYISLETAENKPSLDDLENIFNKFARVARQLRSRYDNRETIIIKDEYDVQDLLHALLVLHFDDVRAEEWTPSYAGSCERMDFLLKDLQTVIEVKKTRPSMSKKELGEELIIDIEKYKAHQECKQLYCFVYDPDGHLRNPAAIKNDLEKTHQGFVRIFIRPEV